MDVISYIKKIKQIDATEFNTNIENIEKKIKVLNSMLDVNFNKRSYSLKLYWLHKNNKKYIASDFIKIKRNIKDNLTINRTIEHLNRNIELISKGDYAISFNFEGYIKSYSLKYLKKNPLVIFNQSLKILEKIKKTTELYGTNYKHIILDKIDAIYDIIYDQIEIEDDVVVELDIIGNSISLDIIITSPEKQKKQKKQKQKKNISFIRKINSILGEIEF